MMKPIRFILGKIILALDALFTPKGLVRSPQAQAAVNEKTRSWTLYQLRACPFCVKVRRQLKRLSITLPIKNVDLDPDAQAELMQGGKIDQVPCLRWRDQNGQDIWMYESSEINQFLTQNFSQ